MAVVTADFLAAIMTNFQLWYGRSFDAADNVDSSWRDLAMETNSFTDTESYSWLGTVPQMVDTTKRDLEVQGLFPFNFSVPNLTFKSGIEVSRATFEDDKYNQIRPRLEELGQEAARHPAQLTMRLMADNALAFDGVAFFADTRTIGRSANIDNNLTGGGVTTVAQIQTDLGLARAAMRKFQDDQGRAMNNTPNVIVVPAEIEQIMYQALNANQGTINQPVVPASNSGVAQTAGFKVIVNPFLTDANDWFVFATSGVRKPFVYQKRIGPALEGITTPTTAEGVIRDRYVYAVRGRYNVANGDPRYGVRITN